MGAQLFANLLFSSVGFVAFIYGKRQHIWKPMFIGLALMAAQRGTMKFALPFGTFLAIGAIVAMFVGEPLIAWYAGFL